MDDENPSSQSMRPEPPDGALLGQFELKWVAPPGWGIPNDGFRPDRSWEPDPYWPASPPHYPYWQVSGTEQAMLVFDRPPRPKSEPKPEWMAPPGWPAPPAGWSPDEDWKPDPRWPNAPAGWQFWRVTEKARLASLLDSVATRAGRLEALNGTEHTLTHHSQRWRKMLRSAYPGVSFAGAERVKVVEPSRWAKWLGMSANARVRPPEYIAFVEHVATLLAAFLEAIEAKRNTLVAALVSDTGVPPSYAPWATEVERRGTAFFDVFDEHEFAQTVAAKQALSRTAPIADGALWTSRSQRASRVSYQPKIVEWEAAEALAASALQRMGYLDARVTAGGADGGVDVRGTGVVAQVKYLNRPIGRPVLQQLVGASAGARPVCFSRSGYTSQAMEYGNSAGIALFTIGLPTDVTAKNQVAAHMLSVFR